jgi:virginiamycin B lyase
MFGARLTALLAAVLMPADAALAQDGKQLADSMCTSCHRFTLVTRSSGYTAEGWRQLIGTMADLSGSESILNSVSQYLAKVHPPNTRRAPKLVQGQAKVAFRDWQPPTLGQRARDAVQAPDGTIWWAGELANLIGSIDPQSGAMKEYPLPRDTSPHAVEIDGMGNVWFSGPKNGTVGYLDPKSGKPTVFKTGGARDPHLLAIDRNGMVWFTAEAANTVGRLDPGKGEVRLVALKTAGAKPSGIRAGPDGSIWVACAGEPCLYRIDRSTLAATEIRLPAGSTVRRLDVAADGTVWFANAAKGRIGRYEPGSGAIKEWPAPSGPRSQPYAIAATGGMVWFNESGMRPDPLVRFDPKTEAFQSWPIPSGGVYAGSAQSIRPTPDGGLVLNQSSTSRIVKVTVQGPR